MNDIGFPKDTQLDIPGFTELARGEPCMLKIEGVCNGDWATTVWCHSPLSRHGRGKDWKSHDIFGALGCSACHHWLDFGKDATRAEKEEVLVRAMEKSHLHFWRVGKFHVKPIRYIEQLEAAGREMLRALGPMEVGGMRPANGVAPIRAARAKLDELLKKGPV